MISISTVEAFEIGAVVFHDDPRSTFLESAPRASRVATLDGGSQVIHGGVCEGDRTFRIYGELSEADTVKLWAIHFLGENVHLSCKVGFFLGYIESLHVDNGDLRMTFNVKEKLSQ